MAEHSEPRSWRQTVGPRLWIVGALLSVWAVAVFVRLVDLQIVQHAALEARGKAQQERRIEERAQRGDIVDRHGTLLAYTVEEATLSVDPRELGNPRQAVARLCGALGDCTADERIKLETTLSQSTRGDEEIRPWLSEEQERRVAALEKMPGAGPEKKPGVRVEKMPGIKLEKKPRRIYPNKELAASVLGFVGDENKAHAGLERRYDEMLSGQPGRMILLKDGVKWHAPFSRVGEPALPGKSIELTIDAVLQALVERELHVGVEENCALGGCAIVMDPATGEILAMASEPTFDPNDYNRVPAERRHNRAVQDIYEPGSTFKLVTASAALEEKVLRPTDLIDTGNGTITIGSRKPIGEAQGHRYGTISFSDVIVLSSNVGAVKVGLLLRERLGRYVERFGFGMKLSPDFRNGESRGRVPRLADWSDSTLASVAMGYEISVTPLQMATAASAVANGGELVMPRVVRAVIDGDRRVPVPRKVIRRAISTETAAELTSMMEGVVERGTAKKAALTDFTVAGKTGTTNKLVDRIYSKTDYNVSFVGFVPSRQPALTILVVIDTPRGPNKPFGGTVAAPIFHRIAEAALRYLGVSPTNPAPPVLLARHDAGAMVRTSGPAAPVTIVPASAPATAGQIVLPELRGLSGREAVRILMRLGVTPRIAGEGVVIEQDPLPGSPVEAGGACRLALGRLAPGGRP
jgi:cell division protein FtsI (penicillin-binding protein 3)